MTSRDDAYLRSRRTNQHLLGAWLAAAVLLAAPAATVAQDVCREQGLPPAGESWRAELAVGRLDQLVLAGCLGGPGDTAPISIAVRKTLDVPREESDRFRPAAEAALDAVAEHVDTLRQKQPDDVLRDLRLQIAIARSLLGSGQSPAVPAAWELDQGRVFVVDLPLRQSVRDACAERSSTCAAQYDLVKEVVRAATLTGSALSVSETPVMLAHLEETTRRARMWDEYFGVARSQYLWELVLNGRLMPDSREEVNGVKRGFRAVPTSQVMLLHPTVAFEYSNAEPEGNRFAPIALVDLVGYNRWTWKRDGTMGFAVGGSVVLALADHAATNDVGWGVMLHLNHRWSIGATFVGDEAAVIASTDVAQLWTRVSELRKRRMMAGQ